MRKRIVACAAGIAAMGLSTIASAAPYQDAVNSIGGAIHHWGFEEASGDATDSIGAVDLGAVNSPSRTTSTLLNEKYMGLGGTNQSTVLSNSNEDYWYTETAVGIQGATNVSMSYFFYLDTSDMPTHQLHLGLQRSNDSRYLFAVRGDSGDHELVGFARWNDGSDLGVTHTETPRTGVDPADGEWHHVVLTYDSVADVLSLYLDGTLHASVGSFAGEAIGNTVTADDLYFAIGSDPQDLNRTFNGGIDDVTIFGKTLTASEVEVLYSAALVPEPASLALLGLGSLMMIRRRQA